MPAVTAVEASSGAPMELAGMTSEPDTVRLEMLAFVMVEEAIVVVAKVFEPVKVLLPEYVRERSV